MSKYNKLEKEQTFALSPGHVEVSLLPELVTLAEVAAEVVLVLHHILGRNRFSDNNFDDNIRLWDLVTLWIERQIGGAVGGVNTPGSLCSPLLV